MKVKMLTSMAGAEYSLSPGDVREFPDAEAKRLIEAGYAAPAALAKREKAVKPAPAETRAKD